MLISLMLAAGSLFAADEARPTLVEGIENVVPVCPRIYSGGQPPDAASFQKLAALGVKTVVSVDGAKPDVEAAKAAGLEYIHIPIGYDAIEPEQAAAMAKVLKTHDGTIFIHCHHGLHRGPAMAGLVLRLETGASPEEAAAFMEKAGTGADYKGLWRDVREFTPERIAGLDPELRAVADLPDFITAMSGVSLTWERLLAAQKKGWEAAGGELDAAPAHQALLLHEGYYELVRLSGDGWDAAFLEAMKESEAAAKALSEAVKASNWLEADIQMRQLKSGCTSCHTVYRNNTELTAPAP